MSKAKTLAEKVLAGEIVVSKCDLEQDFSLKELKVLLDKQVIQPSDLSQGKVTELMIHDALSPADYPYERLEPRYQLQLLQKSKIKKKDFLAKLDVKSLSNRDWLTLLGCVPSMREKAPWEQLRQKATADEWTSAILECPELYSYADKDRLSRICSEKQLIDIEEVMKKDRLISKFADALLMKLESDFDFQPENELETAIMARDYATVVKILVTQQGVLTRPDVFAKEEFIQAPTAVAALIVHRCASPKLLEGFSSFWKHHCIGWKRLVTIISATKKLFVRKAPTEERPLLCAIRQHGDEDIQFLSQAIHLSMSQDFFHALPHLCYLKKSTLVKLFCWSIPDEIKSALMFLLLDECQSPRLLKDHSHEERLMLTNLIIHIIMGEITPDDKERIEEDWYPLGKSASLHSYSYYYDPQTAPQKTEVGDDGYEKPSHSIRRPQ